MLVTNQLLVAIDSHCIFWKAVATNKFLVTNIFQNIIFCAQRKKETHEGE